MATFNLTAQFKVYQQEERSISAPSYEVAVERMNAIIREEFGGEDIEIGATR